MVVCDDRLTMAGHHTRITRDPPVFRRELIFEVDRRRSFSLPDAAEAGGNNGIVHLPRNGRCALFPIA